MRNEYNGLITIPQWKYDIMHDTCTRARMLKAEIEYEKKKHKDGGYDWEPTLKASKVERIMAFDCPKQYTNDIKDVETMDTLADVLGHTE